MSGGYQQNTGILNESKRLRSLKFSVARLAICQTGGDEPESTKLKRSQNEEKLSPIIFGRLQ